MNGKIWKALGIVVCMLALAAPHAMAETITHTVTADTHFADVVKNINASGVDDENVIELCADITLTGNHTLKRSTTIKSKDEDRKISINGSNAGITVTGEKTVLNLGAKGYEKKLTIEGDTRVAFITVSEEATANMYENVTLQNRKSVINACIVIMGSKSVFNMHGGVIKKCSRAVIADSGATFHMLSGKIEDCEVDGNGVIFVNDNSKFIMEDGTISGCLAVNFGGGLYAKKSSTITISGGTISGCEGELGCGLYADNSTIEITDGTISGCKGLLGGGLYANNSTVTIKDGTISGCTAGAGGGLYVVGSTLNIKGGTISECFVSDTGKGGGLFADQSILTISGGTIKGNKAAYGGGVALRDSTIQEIKNWKVVGNKAYKTNTGTGYIGGGIYLENGSMDVSDGSNQIYNNTADGHGADICLEGGASIKLPNAAKMGVNYHDSGIKIDNWYNDNPRYTPSENGAVVEANKLLTGELSLVASYKAIPTCTVTIDANGGVGGSGSQTVQKGTTVTLEAPTKEGHLFTGWKDEKGNSYPAGADGKVNITVNEDMKLTAVWEARTFTVTYVLLDGKTRTETVAYGQKLTLGEEPRTGYTFVGWKDGEKVYRAGETITVNEDMKLTAVWEARTFMVTYVLPDGKTRTETAAYGQTVTLVEEPRIGYTFVGWKDGEKVYHAGETITVTGDMTLTAEWEKLPSALVRIEIDANGGVGGSGSQTVQKGKTVTLEAPTKEGHLFKGWKDEKGNSYPAGTDGKVKITVNEDMKLTAVWEARTFTVTYVLLDGKTRTETVAYGQKLTLGEEPRTGYTFVGWKDGEKMYHAGETITVTEDKTLTAVWDTRSFTVTYVLLNGKTRTETVAYGQKLTLGEEPRTGYTFVGWKDGEKMYHAGETITVTEDMTLTAEWEKLPSAENLPKTGDESPVLLWSAVLVVSAAAGFMLKRKK